ncbi:MAG TPA: membrane dipeptidase [Acidimicrobiia bacterium]
MTHEYSRFVSEEALSLHADAIVIDGTSFYLEGHTDLLDQAGVTALNLTVPDIEDDTGGAVLKVSDHYQLAREDPRLALVFTPDDILAAKTSRKVGMILGAQNARHMASRPALVEMFYRLGMRVSQLTYNDRSFAADGCDTGADAGLSREGKTLVEEMNRVGMVVDVSHAGERSAKEAVALCTKPPIASHSNPRNAGANIPRNLDDDLIKAIADKGGVIGLSPFPTMLWKGGDVRPTVEDFLDAMEYVIQLVGVDHVGVGTDKEATAGAYPREVRRRLRRRFANASRNSQGIGYRDKFPDSVYNPLLDGFASIGDFPVITQGLMSRGFGEDEIRKILGLNLLRVFRENWI